MIFHHVSKVNSDYMVFGFISLTCSMRSLCVYSWAMVRRLLMQNCLLGCYRQKYCVV